MRIMEEDSGVAIHSYLRIYQHPLESGVDEELGRRLASAFIEQRNLAPMR
jgi:hypothetical protein